uniref:Uncharacterized protein n=1 Tax=viral metagenome TaxID=1070528 RepID=A0A6M3JTS6_9ZZZZ
MAIHAYPPGPGGLKIFVGGFEITQFVEKVNVSTFINDLTRVELTLSAVNFKFDNDRIFIGEMATDDFLAEMVRLKLRREGVMDKNNE